MRVFGLLILLLTVGVWADTSITTQVYDVDYGRHKGDDILVLLKSGHVAKVKVHKKNMLSKFTENKADDSWFKVTLDNHRYIKSIELSDTTGVAIDLSSLSSAADKDVYVPTTVESMKKARELFSEQRYNPKESQCFNRAMVWTYEWWKKHSLKSNKALIFFTRNFIRRYDFDWWFHITPYIHVMGDDGKVVERTMDRKYTSGPLSFNNWTSVFMKGRGPCPAISKFSEYADNPFRGECMLIRTYMYTYQPADLQMNEAWGYTKNAFNMDEVKAAYLEAFDEHI